MYVFAVYATRAHLNDLSTNTCGLVSRRGTCFWDCRSIRSVKSVRRGKRRSTLKEFRGCECGFAPHRTQGYASFSRRPRALFATLGAAGLSCTHRSQRGLHDNVVVFTLCLLFNFRARLLALSFLLPSPFCHHNNETTSAATALRTINLCKCTQIL